MYSRSDIYLLDDPMSALDPVVARDVFDNVIGKNGILKNKVMNRVTPLIAPVGRIPGTLGKKQKGTGL